MRALIERKRFATINHVSAINRFDVTHKTKVLKANILAINAQNELDIP
jgi:hypothetical protein